ncbi:hypothetical protein [Vibrio vulnificus]|uniref:hypothetical protein n=1 Tax=Vibrio vulnificus TaxID=672 RepID=UPI00068FAC92|nr:hypothetical protein [Vibrio vulnificus]ASJ39824.1 hypothetical protein VVCECT4999_14410 [Vibrio vulnificus]EGR0642084.1 hypothetical protein [Vibrio vulnificus]PNG67941.1 hypothetical protein TI24_20385 [Vibrio vulnificus]PNG72887.1 hypothetical protein TI31_21585 [Vibrio vulnificus]POB72835.1 hypothetical protein CRN62_13995 [Vibrio vulnificus]
MNFNFSIPLPIFLLFWYIVPSFVMVLFNQASLSTGILLSAIIVFLFKSFSYRVNHLYLIFILLLGLYGLISSLYEPSFKAIYSAFVMLFIAASLFPVLDDLSKRNVESSRRGVQKIYIIFIMIGFFGVFRLLEIGPYLGKAYPVPPFSEHSHFALAFSPVSIYMQLVCSSKIKKLLIAIVPLLFGFAFPSLVFVVLAFMQLMLVDRKSCFFSFFLLSVLLSVVVFSQNESMEYFRGRILFDPSNPNLSNLVYLQGWESVYMALAETNFIGLGFQNNGMQQSGPMTNIIFSIYSGVLNRFDGGFLASKIISEFGIFGILFVFIFLLSVVLIWWRCFYKNFLFDSQLNVLFYSLSFSLLIEMIFRGYGYFSPTFMLYIASSILILSRRFFIGASYA